MGLRPCRSRMCGVGLGPIQMEDPFFFFDAVASSSAMHAVRIFLRVLVTHPERCFERSAPSIALASPCAHLLYPTGFMQLKSDFSGFKSGLRVSRPHYGAFSVYVAVFLFTVSKLKRFGGHGSPSLPSDWRSSRSCSGSSGLTRWPRGACSTPSRRAAAGQRGSKGLGGTIGVGPAGRRGA